MEIDFGIVSKYFSDKGFGFVSRTFLVGHQSEVFFHIKNIKLTCPELAQSLRNDQPIGAIYFWYETENTSRGEQVRTILKSDTIHKMMIDNLSSVVVKIENIWKNIDSAIPVWLREVTVDLLGADRVSELGSERNSLESKRRKSEEKKHEEQDARQITEEEKRQKLIEDSRGQEEIEEKEFEQLVAEILSLEFTHSSKVSRYIIENSLGYKYKNISGIVKMEQDGTIWDFKGGFPPKIYARLCKELELSNQGTRARAVGFESFKDLKATRHR